MVLAVYICPVKSTDFPRVPSGHRIGLRTSHCGRVHLETGRDPDQTEDFKWRKCKLVMAVAVSLTIALGMADVCLRLCKYWNSTFCDRNRQTTYPPPPLAPPPPPPFPSFVSTPVETSVDSIFRPNQLDKARALNKSPSWIRWA